MRFGARETDPEWQKKPPKERALRTNPQRKLRESREAALFCYGMSERTARAIGFAPEEAQDHDFVARWDVDGETVFFPVQLKSAVTHDGKDCASIEEVLADLEGKYAPTSKLTVAIYLTQRVRFVPTELKVPKLSVAALWVFAGISADGSEWALWGDFLDPPASGSRFTYPTASGRSAGTRPVLAAAHSREPRAHGR